MITIKLEQDMSVEPGHQVLVIPMTPEGASLVRLLTGQIVIAPMVGEDSKFHIPHTADVDRNIVELINALAHVRFSAPDLVQMTLEESQP